MKYLAGLAFASTISPQHHRAQREMLVACAQVKNASLDLSSVLLYGHGTYMQYIEGPTDPLRSVYDQIKSDQRHRGVIEFFWSRISEREFAGWPMRYFECADKELNSNEIAKWLEPIDVKSQPGHMLLSRFWHGNRQRQ